MGCCLTKKSRVRNKGLNETLLEGEGASDSYGGGGVGRNNGYTPVQMPGDDGGGRRASSTGVSLVSQNPLDRRGSSSVGVDIAGLESLKQTNKGKTRKVVGTSLLILPSIKSLKKTGWLTKRGHLVSCMILMKINLCKCCEIIGRCLFSANSICQ
jgi:hypothetical protein